ncbi:MAG: hypothetical protein WB820_10245, partial [Rhodoplanes sp.]
SSLLLIRKPNIGEAVDGQRQRHDRNEHCGIFAKEPPAPPEAVRIVNGGAGPVRDWFHEPLDI